MRLLHTDQTVTNFWADCPVVTIPRLSGELLPHHVSLSMYFSSRPPAQPSAHPPVQNSSEISGIEQNRTQNNRRNYEKTEEWRMTSLNSSKQLEIP